MPGSKSNVTSLTATTSPYQRETPLSEIAAFEAGAFKPNLDSG
jgi:hypothetical protein